MKVLPRFTLRRWPLLTTLLMLSVAPQALAHPHGWVDYRVSVLVDDQQRARALKQTWKIDPFQSLTMVEGLESVEGDETMEQRLDALGHEIAANLANEHYLTHVYHDGQELALGRIEDYTTQLDDDRVAFSFIVTLSEPQPLTGELRWQVYDSTYFIEFLYDDQTAQPITLINAPESCHAEVHHADPDLVKVAQASSIDVDGEAPEGMGRFFTDTGVMTCPAS